MKKLNKKGFTLIELLAVIVVLAVIMLIAVTAVVPRMNDAKKNALRTDAQSYFSGAEMWYNTQLLEGETPASCVSFSDLEGEYVSTKNASKISGHVNITKNGDDLTYTIWISNGEYSISGKTPEAVAAGSSALDATYTAASDTCS